MDKASTFWLSGCCDCFSRVATQHRAHVRASRSDTGGAPCRACITSRPSRGMRCATSIFTPAPWGCGSKRTVNFDDPGTYHLYYGDETGHPGTVLTFFPWEHAVKGRLGVGETEETAFRVPARALGFWTQRFVEKGVVHETPEQRFGETVLPFSDPDGTRLALVAVPEAHSEPAWSNTIPAEHAIRGFHGVTLFLADAARTGAILTDVLGLAEAGRDGAIVRYRAAGP